MASRLCSATTGGTCDPAEVARRCLDRQRIGEFESATQQVPAQASSWIRSIGVPTHSPDADTRRAFAEVLRAEAFGPMAPASTIVVVDLILAAPELAPEGLLRQLVASPPAGCSFAGWHAYDALQVTATKSDLPLLREHLRSGTIGQKRAAIVAMARIPEARRELAAYLLASPSELEAGIARRIPELLTKSGLVRDHELVADLFARGSPAAREGVMVALGRTEDATRPDSLLASLDGVADDRQSSYDARSLGLEGLGTSGPSGQERLRRIARDPERETAIRLLALEALSTEHDPEGPRIALTLLPTCLSVWEVQMAASIAVNDPAQRPEIVEALRLWADQHPEQLAELRQTRAGRPEVRALLREAVPQEQGG